ncbi:hypothetical protein [Burkholderia ubonensis]|uniref:hypothetical protein n=1 Tax=Burkholderia ubonensis TaxID=101571 RepID=UPI0018E107A3|nr:hypothetical protein [Burkholderia ubonensis]
MSAESVSQYARVHRHEIKALAEFEHSWSIQPDHREQSGRLIRVEKRAPHGVEKARIVGAYKLASDTALYFHKKAHEGVLPAASIYARDGRIRAIFEPLRDAWHRETGVLSSTTDIVLNENYQKIIGLGPQAVPWILDDLRVTSAPWFWALRMITREDPVAPRDRGRINRMVDAWLNWAQMSDIE